MASEHIKLIGSVAATALLTSVVVAYGLHQQQHKDGYRDTPIIPGQKWHVHDVDRPYPAEVTPGQFTSTPPSDAVVIFDGKDLSHLCMKKDGDENGQDLPPLWKLVDHTIEVVPGTGYLFTKEKFGDCQVHIEWRENPNVAGHGQGRGNSGIFLSSKYEIQVLDSYHSATYADGQAGAIYGQWPPMVNPIRPPGEWNSYDIIFHRPHWDGDKVVEPAYITLFFNGVLVHEHQALNGPTGHAGVFPYEKQNDEEPIAIQDHQDKHPMRFRNFWVRPLKGYDQPEVVK